MALSRLLSLTLAIVLSQTAQAQNWPQFRGPSGNGHVQATLPVKWGAEENIAWKAPVVGLGWSQPVVWGDRIYLTTADTGKLARPKNGDWTPGIGLFGLSAPPKINCKWKVLCLNAATGDVVWEKTAKEGRPVSAIHASNSYATETPVTDGERLIVSFGMTGLFCYDLSGEQLWTRDLGTYPTQFGWGTASSPILWENRVILQCDNEKDSFLVALDKTSGDEQWRMSRLKEKSNWATPYLWQNAQRTELVAAGGGKTRSYDPATGSLLWEMSGAGRTSMTPVGDDELLYVDTQDRLAGSRGVLAAIRAGASGDISLKEGETSNASIAWTIHGGGNRVASPLLVDGRLYTFEQQAAIVRCVDATSGQELYRQRIPKGTGVTASPLAANARIYVVGNDGLTLVLKPGPKFEVLAENKLDEMFWSSPSVAGNRLLLRGAEHLYAIQAP